MTTPSSDTGVAAQSAERTETTARASLPPLSRAVPYLLVAPVAIYLTVIVIGPLAIQIYNSFLDRERGQFAYRIVHRFTLENYEQILAADILGSLVWTISISLVIALGSVIIGLPIAHFLARGRGRGKLFVEMALLLPLFGDIFLAYALLYAFAPQGIVNWALMGMGITDTPVRISGTPLSAVIAMMLPGLTVLLVRSALVRIDPVYEEAARMLGAHPFRAYVSTTLYLARVGIGGAFLLTFAAAVGAFTLPVILAGRVNDWFSTIIWFETEVDNIPLASALSVTLTVITALTIYVYNRLSNRRSEVRRYVG